MKQTERQKIAYAIRNGLPQLRSGWGSEFGKSDYICFAIGRGRYDGMPNDAGVIAAQKMIHKRIAPHTVVEDWLAAQGVKRIGIRRLQAYRKAWMLQLIEEFSK